MKNHNFVVTVNMSAPFVHALFFWTTRYATMCHDNCVQYWLIMFARISTTYCQKFILSTVKFQNFLKVQCALHSRAYSGIPGNPLWLETPLPTEFVTGSTKVVLSPMTGSHKHKDTSMCYQVSRLSLNWSAFPGCFSLAHWRSRTSGLGPWWSSGGKAEDCVML